MHKMLTLMLALTLFAGCAEQDPSGGLVKWDRDETPNAAPTSAATPADPTAEPTGSPTEPGPAGDIVPVRFLIIGDQGSGDDNQYAVAETMKRVCAAKGCDFVMTTGDNIYDAGASSPYDTQFDDKFEVPYAGMTDQAGGELPFFLSLGNHDNMFGGFAQVVGENQVLYSERTDRPSTMWNMPDRYYQQRFGPHVEIFAIDTDAIQKDDPMVPDVTPAIHQAWLRDALDASDATWKLAFGHYNYVSNGNYGNGATQFKAAIEASLCDRAQFYVWGHDHDLQWVQPVDSCGRTEFIGSSAASKSRPVDQDFEFPAYFGMGDVLGFAWVEVIGESFHLEFIDVEENVLFERTVLRAELGW